MGMSSDAILFYGIDLGGSEFFYDLTERHGFGEEVLEELDIDSVVERVYGDEDPPFEILIHTSFDDPGYYIAAKVYTSWWGAAKEIKPSDLIPHLNWNTDLEAFCKRMKIDYTRPTWNLVSLYG